MEINELLVQSASPIPLVIGVVALIAGTIAIARGRRAISVVAAAVVFASSFGLLHQRAEISNERDAAIEQVVDWGKANSFPIDREAAAEIVAEANQDQPDTTYFHVDGVEHAAVLTAGDGNLAVFN